MKMFNWEECLYLEGKKEILKHFSHDNTLLIVGLGFDPRQCHVAETMLNANKLQSVYILDYNDVGIRDKQKGCKSDKNGKSLFDLCYEYNINMRKIEIPMYKRDGLKKTQIISESIRSNIKRDMLDGFYDILIDISAMPKGVSFSLIRRLLAIKEDNQRISVIVCENSKYDDSIISIIGEESAEYLLGFNTFSLMMEQEEQKVVWLPILGMKESRALQIIANFLKPIEICPVVPFPSVDVRRGEKMLRACGDVLFREQNVEKRNIIYVPENDPRLVAQKLINTVKYYQKAFSIVKDSQIKFVFSSSSSKMIDIGLLLTILFLIENEERVSTGIIIIDKQGYDKPEQYNADDEKMYCLCLNEQIYEW